jgi:hypothetical protein
VRFPTRARTSSSQSFRIVSSAILFESFHARIAFPAICSASGAYNGSGPSKPACLRGLRTIWLLTHRPSLTTLSSTKDIFSVIQRYISEYSTSSLRLICIPIFEEWGKSSKGILLMLVWANQDRNIAPRCLLYRRFLLVNGREWHSLYPISEFLASKSNVPCIGDMIMEITLDPCPICERFQFFAC